MKKGLVVEISGINITEEVNHLKKTHGIQKIIAFSGGSDEKEEEVAQILDDCLRKLQGLPVAILTGASKWGIPQFATKSALKYNLATIGILPITGKKHALPKYDFDLQIFVNQYYENSYWGDESPLFAKLADGVVVIGGGSGTLIEVAHAMKINEKLIKPESKRKPIQIVPVLGLSGVSEVINFLPFKEDVKRKVLPFKKIMDGTILADHLIDSLSLYDEIDNVVTEYINKEGKSMNSEKAEAKTLKGFRDLLPSMAIKKEDMLNKISLAFRSFGFSPIETPHIEYANVLVGQGSDEIQKELYRFNDNGGRDVALRFDQTVPLSRFTVQHLRDQSIMLPFKRYAIGNVFRGEKAQKGRYREFTQCDFDFIGTKSISADAEIISLISSSIEKLGINDFTIFLNNRKILDGLMEYLNISEKANDILIVIDKINKIGSDRVKLSLSKDINLTDEQISEIMEFISFSEINYKENFFEVVSKYKDYNDLMKIGIEEVETVYSILDSIGIDKKRYQIDFSIARGLGYYTGIVYETVLDKLPQMGSICSGGRYDNLTKSFSDDDISGVGASIGIDRLIAALEELELIEDKNTSADILITNMDANYVNDIYLTAKKLRENGFNTEVYPDVVKLGKQFKYADKNGHKFVVIIGSDEIANNTFTLKNMITGDQNIYSFDELIEKLKG